MVLMGDGNSKRCICAKEKVLLERKKKRFMAALDLINCLKQIK